jgi:hypothetical protein
MTTMFSSIACMDAGRGSGVYAIITCNNGKNAGWGSGFGTWFRTAACDGCGPRAEVVPWGEGGSSVAAGYYAPPPPLPRRVAGVGGRGAGVGGRGAGVGGRAPASLARPSGFRVSWFFHIVASLARPSGFRVLRLFRGLGFLCPCAASNRPRGAVGLLAKLSSGYRPAEQPWQPQLSPSSGAGDAPATAPEHGAARCGP